MSSPSSKQINPDIPKTSVSPPPAQHEEGSQQDDADRDTDADSAFGSDGAGSVTTSLATSIRDYKYENGRRYHAFREGEYLFPNDDQEQDRLDMLHHIFKLTLGGELFDAPVESLQRVLDFGTGTGIWAIDLADQFPSASIEGTDLSPIQPSWVPPNCTFLVDDVESDWLPDTEGQYDLIHGRNMVGSIGNWEKLFANIYKGLRPQTGWIEMQEFDVWFQSENGPLPADSFISQWQNYLEEASSRFGKQLNSAGSLKDKIIAAGFQDVRDHIIKVPIGSWPKDKNLKLQGRFLQLQMLDSIEPISLGYCTRILGWSEIQTQVFIAKVRAEFVACNASRLFVYCHFVIGRRGA